MISNAIATAGCCRLCLWNSTALKSALLLRSVSFASSYPLTSIAFKVYLARDGLGGHKATGSAGGANGNGGSGGGGLNSFKKVKSTLLNGWISQ